MGLEGEGKRMRSSPKGGPQFPILFSLAFVPSLLSLPISLIISDAARQRQLTTSPSIPKEIAGEKVMEEGDGGRGQYR